jgi:amino acid permease
MEKVDAKQSTLSFWVTVAFTVNFIIGSGFLTIPWAFYQVGSLLGIVVLVAFGIFSIVSVYFILETVERAQILEKYNLEKEENLRLDDSSHDTGDDESHELLTMFNTSEEKVEIVRKREIPELCEIFLGKSFAHFYVCAVSVFVYGVLWAYASVFSHSFAALYPVFGSRSFEMYLFLFACFVIPFSVMELSEQAIVQVVLSFFRFCMFSIMFATVIEATKSGKNEFQLDSVPRIHLENDLFDFHISKIQYLLPIAAFAFLFHHAIPSLAHSTHKKSWLKSLFTISIILCAISYIILGLVVSIYFQKETKSSCNLNWKNYIGRGTPENPGKFAVILRTFVLLFPALDVASAYPLHAFSLGNNLQSAYYGPAPKQKSRYRATMFRLLAACPPVLGALIVSDLGSITNYTGIMGLVLVFAFPPMLARFSESKLLSLGLNPSALQTSIAVYPCFQNFLFSFGIFLVVYVTIAFAFL